MWKIQSLLINNETSLAKCGKLMLISAYLYCFSISNYNTKNTWERCLKQIWMCISPCSHRQKFLIFFSLVPQGTQLLVVAAVALWNWRCVGIFIAGSDCVQGFKSWAVTNWWSYLTACCFLKKLIFIWNFWVCI